MIKVKNKSSEEIAKIGREIGKAFAAEKDGIVKLLTEEQTIKAFIVNDTWFCPFENIMHNFIDTFGS